jgi:D-sedoheptulose 7-phosphate isomerase
MNYITQYIKEAHTILDKLDLGSIEKIVDLLVKLREKQGRLFFLGVGGSAANASHAVNDFRKIAGFESYTPTDNVSELTARINDDGWDSAFVNWLIGSKLSSQDMVFVFSVGGGDKVHNVSVNLVRALEYAKSVGATICGVVGRSGGYTAEVADAAVIIPIISQNTVTPHTEAFQAVIWHMIVSHPKIQISQMKWESTNTAPK